MIRLKLKQRGFRRRYLVPNEEHRQQNITDSFALLDRIASIPLHEEEDDVGPLPIMVPNALIKNSPHPLKDLPRKSVLIRSEGLEVPSSGAYWLRPYSQLECHLCHIHSSVKNINIPTLPFGLVSNFHFHSLILPEIKTVPETDKNLQVTELNLCLEYPQRNKPYLREDQIALNCFRNITTPEKDKQIRESSSIMSLYLTIPEDV